VSDPETIEIIEACRRGDREAFCALYEAHKDKVYSIALYFFHGDPAAASDATQQVFLKLITNIKSFRGDSEFSTWLHRLVVNTCLDGSRKSKSRERSGDPADLVAIDVVPTTNPQSATASPSVGYSFAFSRTL